MMRNPFFSLCSVNFTDSATPAVPISSAISAAAKICLVVFIEFLSSCPKWGSSANDANYANGRINDLLCAHSRNSRHWRYFPVSGNAFHPLDAVDELPVHDVGRL